MRQDVLDRLVSEDRARKVAEILFPEEVAYGDVCGYSHCKPPDQCEPCAELLARWNARISEVRAAIQSTFILPADTPSQGN